jgi:hypothetical protein
MNQQSGLTFEYFFARRLLTMLQLSENSLCRAGGREGSFAGVLGSKSLTRCLGMPPKGEIATPTKKYIVGV